MAKNNHIDFHQVLNIPEGDEPGFFAANLKRILNFKAMAPEHSELDDLNHAFQALCPDGNKEFPALVQALRKKAGILEPPTVAELGALGLSRPLLMDTRMRGAVRIPPEWTPDSAVFTFASTKGDIGDPRRWWIYLCYGMSYYLGQKNDYFSALVSFARYVFTHQPALEEAALTLWDEIGMLIHDGDYGGVMDGLTLAAELPPQHYRIARILSDNMLLSSSSAGIRMAAAKLVERKRPEGYIEGLKESLLTETAALAWEAQIRALRAVGGEAAFEALLEAARTVTNPNANRLAARALAWVMNYPERNARLAKLCASRDSRVSSIGTTAYSELRHHSVFSYGGDLATDEENDLKDGFYDLMEKRANPDQAAVLRKAFESGRVRFLTGEEAARANVGEDGAVVATSDGIVVLKLRREHFDLAREVLDPVCPSDKLTLP